MTRENASVGCSRIVGRSVCGEGDDDRSTPTRNPQRWPTWPIARAHASGIYFRYIVYKYICNDDSCAGETWTGSDPCSTYQCVRNEIHTVTQDCPEIKSCALVRNLCSRINRFYHQICNSPQLSVLTANFWMAVSKTLTLFKLKRTFPSQLKQVC